MSICASERDERIDFLKGMLIVLVVFGHAIESALPESWCGGGVWGWIYCLVYSFHMPAFVFLSGYLSSAHASLFDLTRRLFMLYLGSQLCWCVFCVALGQRLDRETLLFVKPGWGLWYLVSLFAWRAACPVLKEIRKPGHVLMAAVAYAAVVGGVESVGEDFSLSRTIVLFPFYAAGFWTRRDNGAFASAQKCKGDVLWALAFGLLPLLATIAYFRGMSLLHFNNPFSVADLSVWQGVCFRLALFLAAFGATRWLLRLAPRQRNRLGTVGENSLAVYLGHFYLMQFLRVAISKEEWMRHVLWLAPVVTLAAIVIFSHPALSRLIQRGADGLFKTIVGDAKPERSRLAEQPIAQGDLGVTN